MSLGQGTPTRVLLEPDAVELLATWGIPYVEHSVAVDLESAVRSAEEVGYPVVLKVISPDVVHKTDVGGVVVGVRDEVALREGHAQIMESVLAHSPGAEIRGVLVSRHVETKQELIIGAIRDVTFGAVVMAGLGGIFAEALDDVAFRVAPLGATDGLEMLQELRGARLLEGFRGVRPADLDSAAKLLVKVGELLLAEPSVQEIDLNPVAVSADGCVALDARVAVVIAADERSAS